MYEHIQNYMIPGAEIQEIAKVDTNNDGIKEKVYTTIDTVYYFGPRDLSLKEQSQLATINDLARESRKVYIADVTVSFTKKNTVLINGVRYEILKIYPVKDPYGVIHHYKLYVAERKK